MDESHSNFKVDKNNVDFVAAASGVSADTIWKWLISAAKTKSQLMIGVSRVPVGDPIIHVWFR